MSVVFWCCGSRLFWCPPSCTWFSFDDSFTNSCWGLGLVYFGRASIGPVHSLFVVAVSPYGVPSDSSAPVRSGSIDLTLHGSRHRSRHRVLYAKPASTGRCDVGSHFRNNTYSGFQFHRNQPHFFCGTVPLRSEEHTSELQSRLHLVCRLLLEKKKKNNG